MTNLVFPDIPRLYTGLAEFLAVCLMIIQVPPSQRRNLLTLPVFGLGQIGLQYLAGTFELYWWILGILLNLIWMFLTLYYCEKLVLAVIFFHQFKAFIIAEFVASFAWQLYCYSPWNHGLIEFSFMAICYTLLFMLFFLLFKNERTHYAMLNISHKSVINAFIITIIIFTMSNLGFLLAQTSFSLGSSSTIFMMRTFIDLCGILLFMIQENQRYEHFLNNDLRQMHNIFQSQYEQYEAYREGNELINQRFHDLKHQLDVIALEDDSTKRRAYVTSLRQEIKQYKADITTGNPIADVILTRKNAYCIKNQITFTCIADGSLLDNIEVMDLCSLLGNTLDNAIEATAKIPEPEKRLINLRISQKANFILYSLENYLQEDIQIQAGSLPSTTKKDPNNLHGYGLKSVDYIAKKYGGTLTINTHDNWFTTRILLPL